MTTQRTDAAATKATMGIIAAVGDCIRELGEVPAGHLYARLMGAMTLEQFQKIIGVLVNCRVVKNENHLLTWVGPQKGEGQ